MALCAHISLQLRPTHNLALCALTTLALCALKVVSVALSTRPQHQTGDLLASPDPGRYPGDQRSRAVQHRGRDRAHRHEEEGLDNFFQNTLSDQLDLVFNMPVLILDMFVLSFDMFC